MGSISYCNVANVCTPVACPVFRLEPEHAFLFFFGLTYHIGQVDRVLLGLSAVGLFMNVDNY